mmetsp:Transcript_13627/g.23197  ORF Transcript_13627/g.23197 Transcript_13627/m.23197 type:complete len:589 (-) Transcript_13627:479-2245(-)
MQEVAEAVERCLLLVGGRDAELLALHEEAGELEPVLLVEVEGLLRLEVVLGAPADLVLRAGHVLVEGRVEVVVPVGLARHVQLEQVLQVLEEGVVEDPGVHVLFARDHLEDELEVEQVEGSARGRLAHVVDQDAHALALQDAQAHELLHEDAQLVAREVHLDQVEDQVLELGLPDHHHLVHEGPELVQHQVVVQHQGEQVLDQHRAQGQPLVDRDLRELPEGDQVLLDRVDDAPADRRRLLHLRVRLLEEHVALQLCYPHRQSSEVEDCPLAALETDGGEVYAVGAGLYVGEGDSERLLVAEELDVLHVEVDQHADHVSHRPGLPVRQVLPVPLLDAEAVIGVGSALVAHAHALLRAEGSLQRAESDLHEPARLQQHLVVEPPLEDAGVGADRNELALGLDVELVIRLVDGLAVGALWVELGNFRSDSPDDLALLEVADVLLLLGLALALLLLLLQAGSPLLVPPLVLGSLELHGSLVLVVEEELVVVLQLLGLLVGLEAELVRGPQLVVELGEEDVEEVPLSQEVLLEDLFYFEAAVLERGDVVVLDRHHLLREGLEVAWVGVHYGHALHVAVGTDGLDKFLLGLHL